jgi:SNF2 family DNA or RNA helicase
MAYQLFEIPSPSGKYIEVILADPETTTAPAYTHYAYTIGTAGNINEVQQRRGIPLISFRNWEYLFDRFPVIQENFKNQREYYAGKNVIENDSSSNFHTRTVMRLGALELLGNIFSGRITASEKDPFPHQLALQQYMKAYENKVTRLLIADEVGLGKTIEVGLLLRDILIGRGSLDKFSCLYLTKGGLLDDVCSKLQSVIRDTVGDLRIVQTEKSFTKYGENNISGIHIASTDAARLYVEKKERLPHELINPEILVIDECHHCGSSENLSDSDKVESSATNQTYKAAYQLITGKFWKNSEPPKIVIFMSATPFRSRPQFVNLLRLLTHGSLFEDAYSAEITEEKLIESLKEHESPVSVIWRQQDDVQNVHKWSGERLFPNLSVERTYLRTTPEYIETIERICDTIKRICSSHGQSFGGFAKRQFEIRLTSSSIAGACGIFRWCILHQKWSKKEAYNQDQSDGTKNLRKLIREVSRRLATYDGIAQHADVSFLGDNFRFTATSIAQPTSRIPEIYDFNKKLLRNDDNDSRFIATSDEIFKLTELGLKLLNFTGDDEANDVENIKLNWLKEMLQKEPDSKYLVFTESLQTCEIITKLLPQKLSEKLTGSMSPDEREEAVFKLRSMRNPARVLVATSAADEGFDFQVANRVVHWDLSPNPAVLMQRNGRVARLGQISDVISYYLIIEGTHEERREKALVARFNQLGITDEKIRLKTLGSLSIQDEEKISKAIDEDHLSLVDEILDEAKTGNEEMERRLGRLQKELKAKSVIDRFMLAERLEYWDKIKFSEHQFNLNFNMISWERPVFQEFASTTEQAEAKVVTIQHKKITFDPEFKVFGQDSGADRYSLAGLRPWVCREYRDVLKQRPDEKCDPIGNICCSLARQHKADLMTISEEIFLEKFQDIKGVRYLLFATHPIREIETGLTENACYLTFYAFGECLEKPLQPHGASADDVYKIISLLEKEIIENEPKALEPNVKIELQEAGKKIGEWVKNVRKLGGFTQQYFLPIPVALIAILPS